MMHIYVEIQSQESRRKVDNYLTKCQALGSNVEDEVKLRITKPEQQFYDTVNDAVVRECIKLESIR